MQILQARYKRLFRFLILGGINGKANKTQTYSNETNGKEGM